MRHALIFALLILMIAPVAPLSAQDAPRDIAALIDSASIEAHIRALAVEIGARPAGSEAEAEAADYIAAQFEAWGYAVSRQAFEVPQYGITSQNVIAHQPATGTNAESGVIVIGAHYDSVTNGTGADDNASGVATVLAAAEALAGIATQHDLVFVAFGSEENGLHGSRAFVDALTPEERDRVLVMFNVDTVGIGDYAYVYAGAIVQPEFVPGSTWARDLALDAAAGLGHDVRTSPPGGWDGFTGMWSDHAPFVEHGIAVAYFERWNWDAGDDPMWGQETAAEGDYLHTRRDTFENVDPALVEPVAETLAASVAALAAGEFTPPPAES